MKGCPSGQGCLVMATGVCNVNAGQGKQEECWDFPAISLAPGSVTVPISVECTGVAASSCLSMCTLTCVQRHAQTPTPTLHPPFNFHSHFLHFSTIEIFLYWSLSTNVSKVDHHCTVIITHNRIKCEYIRVVLQFLFFFSIAALSELKEKLSESLPIRMVIINILAGDLWHLRKIKL